MAKRNTSTNMANSNSKKLKLDLSKIKESIKRDKKFDLIEHEILKFAYIFKEIIKKRCRK